MVWSELLRSGKSDQNTLSLESLIRDNFGLESLIRDNFGLESLIRDNFGLESLIRSNFGSGPQPGWRWWEPKEPAESHCGYPLEIILNNCRSRSFSVIRLFWAHLGVIRGEVIFGRNLVWLENLSRAYFSLIIGHFERNWVWSEAFLSVTKVWSEALSDAIEPNRKQFR